MVTKEDVEAYYSRLPLLRPPPEIIVLTNRQIGADTLYDAHNWTILGMQRQGEHYINVAGNAPLTTYIHEGLHANGIRSEGATRVLTRLAVMKARWSPGILRQVHYEAAPVTPKEKQAILDKLHLSGPDADGTEVIRLVYQSVAMDMHLSDPRSRLQQLLYRP